jgi:hypothetical protein
MPDRTVAFIEKQIKAVLARWEAGDSQVIDPRQEFVDSLRVEEIARLIPIWREAKN